MIQVNVCSLKLGEARAGAGRAGPGAGACQCGDWLLEIRRSVLVPYSAEGMFDLIEQAEHYPQFLPWCVGATILERSDDWVAARIEFNYMHVRFGFRTRNPKRRPEWLSVRLVEGPFRRFQADWQLTPLGRQGCKVAFDLTYEVSDGVLDRLAARAVDVVSRSMMDAFIQRAEATLGVPSAPAALPLPRVPASPPAAGNSVSITTTGNTMNTHAAAPLDLVRASPLAQDMSADEAAVLAPLLTLQAVPAKQVLAREGTVDNRLYVLVEGSLAVVKQAGTSDEAQLHLLAPGDFAHELGFLDGAARYASLVAATDSRVLVLEREKLESLIDSHPRVLYRVMCAIVRVVHRVQTRLAVESSELTNYIVKQHGRY
jgi:ribosome-associated toxin RatA of RatAB toxin-antitoxin module/CRP-like cAMP-binding protein